jgi:hypothetical protein
VRVRMKWKVTMKLEAVLGLKVTVRVRASAG